LLAWTSSNKSEPGRKLERVKKNTSKRGHWIGEEEFAQLKANLTEAQETLEAIRNGAVDAVVIHGPNGNQVYSLNGADQPYRVYVERMEEGAVTLSGDGLILYANKRFADMLNKPLEQVISAKIEDYLDETAWKKIHAVFENENEFVKYESVLKTAGKEPLPVHLTASHLPLVDQNVLCLVVTDLSSQKQNEALRTAKEVAEKANKAKDDFLAALSHELRTPLNPVLLLSSEGAEDPELLPRTRADFATIRDNIELEARLIDDLLDLNRIVYDKLRLQLKPADCHEILDNALAMVEPDLRKKKIMLDLDLQKGPREINVDRTRLQQVFWNVLKNAVKFTPENGRIKIATAVSPEKKYWSVAITDTGIGLTREEIQGIFDAFTQGEHAKGIGSHQFGGLGLGLSISKMLIKMHDGAIQAQSEGRGKGTTFTIQLPMPPQASKGSK
jgi:signal transduction histidine kinase